MYMYVFSCVYNIQFSKANILTETINIKDTHVKCTYMYMYIYTCTYMYICTMYTYIYIYIHVHVHTCIHTCTCTVYTTSSKY